MPESSLRSFRANVIPHSGSTRAPSCSRTALVGARPGTDCTGPDSAFSHDAGCQRPGVRPRHSRRHAPHHPVGGTQPASRGLNGPPNCLLRCGCAATATGPDHPVLRGDFPFGNCCHFSGTNPFAKVLAGLAPLPFFPAFFTFKTTLRLPFWGADANPCTRGTTPHPAPGAAFDGFRRPLDDLHSPGRPPPGMITCLHVAGMWLQLSCGHPLPDFPFRNSRRNRLFCEGPRSPPVVLA